LRRVAIATLLIIACGATARGEFLTNLSVAQEPGSAGRLRYTYTLTNLPASNQLASLFQLDVAANAGLQSITNTIGWDVTYSPGSPSVIWTSAINPTTFTTNDLAPGVSGQFSFESSLGPVGEAYLIAGINPSGGFGSSNEGLILGPGGPAVPAPTGFVLFVLGAAGLIVSRRILRVAAGEVASPSPHRRPETTAPTAG